MKKNVIVGLLILGIGTSAFAQIGGRIKGQGIAGTWVNNNFGFSMTLLLLDNGSGEFDGEAITYTATADRLELKSAAGTTAYQYALANGVLTLSGGDLDAPIAFRSAGQPAVPSGSQQQPANAGAIAGADPALLGKWEYQGQVLEFQSGDQLMIDGNAFRYQAQRPNLTLLTAQGNIQFQYQIAGEALTLTGPGGTLTYKKYTGQSAVASPAGQSGGQVPAELAGKWCYVNVVSTGSGGWSTDECITLRENGTYEYYSENSGSATVTNQYGGQVATGGTASQNSDAGTWSLQGNMIVARSQSGAVQSFTFEKRNHPKNGDPMIVLNGRTYVTFYNKPPWR